jgi:hypothetical protein
MAHETTGGQATPQEHEGRREANGRQKGGRKEAKREQIKRERFGPLELERHVKDDGRALILYFHAPEKRPRRARGVSSEERSE